MIWQSGSSHFPEVHSPAVMPIISHHPWVLAPDDHEFPVTPPTSDYDSESNPFDFNNTIPLNTKAVVAVIGVGYVGAHLINSFSEQYKVIGYDISKERIQEIANDNRDKDNVRFTARAADITEATHFLISVPTLLLPDKMVDSSSLRGALMTVRKHARTGATVVIESSVAMGMTRKLLGPLAAARGFFAGMSPEVCTSILSHEIVILTKSLAG